MNLAFHNILLAAADVNSATKTDAGSVTNNTTATQIVSETVMSLWYSFLERIPLLIGGIIVLLFVILVAALFKRSARKLLSRFKLKESQRTLIIRLITILIWIVGLLITAMVIFPDLTPAKALAGLGIGSIAVGFAFKDIFENFFAGILILWKFPFENGDYIECGGIVGKVEDVTIRNTFIRRMSGELVVIPNATIFKSNVDIITSYRLRRTTIIAGVAYGEDVDQSREVITKAVKSCKTVSDEKPVEIFAQEFASSSINFEVTWWAGSTPLDIRKSRDEVVAAVKRALDQAGIEIPFPYTTLTFKHPLKTVMEKQKDTDIS